MSEIDWGSILSIGVDEVDEDHRKLIDTFNILSRALVAGEPPEYLAAVLDELIKCTVWHFAHEERLMLKYAYPDREEHLGIHQALTKSALELQKTVLDEEKSIAAGHIEFLEHWLTEHILTEDMRMGAYLSQVM